MAKAMAAQFIGKGRSARKVMNALEQILIGAGITIGDDAAHQRQAGVHVTEIEPLQPGQGYHRGIDIQEDAARFQATQDFGQRSVAIDNLHAKGHGDDIEAVVGNVGHVAGVEKAETDAVLAIKLAASDIQQATSLARRYVGQWGLSDAIGPILVGDNEQELFLGRELQTRREVSERTAQLVDAEVSRVIKEAYNRAKETLTENMDLLHRVAEALLDRETLSGEEVMMLERGEKLPPRPTPPSNPPALPANQPVLQPKAAKPPLFGGPEVAPA